MKLHALVLLSGPGAALIPSAPAGREFCCVVMEFPPNPLPALLTARVYAVFSPAEPGDRVLSVSGTPAEPAARVYGGTFFQHQSGGDTAPDPISCILFPSACFDTFVTIGRLVQPDATELSPGWPGFTECVLTGTDVSWSVAPDDPQAVPDAQGRVLLGQFSVPKGGGLALPGFHFRVRMISAGQEIELEQGLCFSLGTPCVAADIDLDLHVGITDFLLLLASWGPTLG